MKVRLTLYQGNCGQCLVEREPGDPVFKDSEWGSGESRLLYHVKKILNKRMGYDFIKKRMWRDGHMVSDQQLYLRERKRNGHSRCLAIYNSHWQINGADWDFNVEGVVSLTVEDIGGLATKERIGK